MWSFLSLSIMLSRFFHVSAAWIISFCSQVLSYPVDKLPFSSSFHPLIYTWIVCTSQLSWRTLLWTLVYKHLEFLFSILWGPYPEMEVLGHMETLCLTFWGILTGFWSLPPGFTGGFSVSLSHPGSGIFYMFIHSYTEFREHPNDYVWSWDMPCDVRMSAQFRFSCWDLRWMHVEAGDPHWTNLWVC